MRRMWTVEKQASNIHVSSSGIRRHGERVLKRAMRIIIESGAIYTVSVVLFAIVLVAKNNAQYPISDPVRQFLLVIE